MKIPSSVTGFGPEATVYAKKNGHITVKGERKSNDIRSELSQALEYLTEVVDDDMDVRERAEIHSRLQRVTRGWQIP